jgi:hypothetical protein
LRVKTTLSVEGKATHASDGDLVLFGELVCIPPLYTSTHGDHIEGLGVCRATLSNKVLLELDLYRISAAYSSKVEDRLTFLRWCIQRDNEFGALLRPL